MAIALQNLILQRQGRDPDDDKSVDYDDEYAFTKEHVFKVVDTSASAETATVATIKVQTIDRKLIRPGEFHVYMDNISEDFLQFSVAVFDHNGRIKRDLTKAGSTLRGSGVWGSEINRGKLAYIELLRVKEDCQRQGVGRWTIESLLSNKSLADCAFCFAWATAIDTRSFFAEPDPNYASIFAEKKAGVTEFWRALGFRRVGGTWFFGYARDPQHVSRALPVEDDGAATQMDGTTSDAVICTHLGI